MIKNDYKVWFRISATISDWNKIKPHWIPMTLLIGSLNCAAFEAGIIEAVLDGCNFPAKVSAHWHKGTTFMVKFDEQVIARDKLMDWKCTMLNSSAIYVLYGVSKNNKPVDYKNFVKNLLSGI